MDVVELDAASNNGVDNVRTLREEAVFTPAAVKKRVYIIDEVHMLSLQAFNALLKILEEPPEHLMFILATTELNKVPATILSRCQRHSFKRIDVPELAEYLEYIAEKESMKLSHEAAELIARMAEGGVRDALSLLDQCAAREEIDLDAVYTAMGLAGKRRVAELLDRILRHDTAGALQLFSALWMEGRDPGTLLGELAQLLRDTLLQSLAPEGGENLLSSGFDRDTLARFASRMTKEELLCALETLQRAQSAMKTVTNPRMNAELCLVSLCDNTLGESVASLRARLSRLEAGFVPAPPQERPEAPQPKPEKPKPEARPLPNEAPAPEMRSAPLTGEQSGPEEILQTETEAEPSLPEREKAERESELADPEGAWRLIRRRAAPQLPMDVRAWLDNADMICGKLEGEVLRLEAVSFAYGRCNRPEILQIFASAASSLRGSPVRVTISDMKQRQRQPGRSLDELKQFAEVKFL